MKEKAFLGQLSYVDALVNPFITDKRFMRNLGSFLNPYNQPGREIGVNSHPEVVNNLPGALNYLSQVKAKILAAPDIGGGLPIFCSGLSLPPESRLHAHYLPGEEGDNGQLYLSYQEGVSEDADSQISDEMVNHLAYTVTYTSKSTGEKVTVGPLPYKKGELVVYVFTEPIIFGAAGGGAGDSDEVKPIMVYLQYRKDVLGPYDQQCAINPLTPEYNLGNFKSNLTIAPDPVQQGQFLNIKVTSRGTFQFDDAPPSAMNLVITIGRNGAELGSELKLPYVPIELAKLTPLTSVLFDQGIQISSDRYPIGEYWVAVGFVGSDGKHYTSGNSDVFQVIAPKLEEVVTDIPRGFDFNLLVQDSSKTRTINSTKVGEESVISIAQVNGTNNLPFFMLSGDSAGAHTFYSQITLIKSDGTEKKLNDPLYRVSLDYDATKSEELLPPIMHIFTADEAGHISIRANIFQDSPSTVYLSKTVQVTVEASGSSQKDGEAGKPEDRASKSLGVAFLNGLLEGDFGFLHEIFSALALVGILVGGVQYLSGSHDPALAQRGLRTLSFTITGIIIYVLMNILISVVIRGIIDSLK